MKRSQRPINTAQLLKGLTSLVSHAAIARYNLSTVELVVAVSEYLRRHRVRDADVSRSIRDLRSRLSLSQQAFAQRLRVAYATVQKWEQKNRPPTNDSQLDALTAMAMRAGYDDIAAIFARASITARPRRSVFAPPAKPK